MANLDVITTISLSSQGITVAGKQGTSANPSTTPLTISVTGTVHKLIGTCGTGAAVVMYDASATDYPATWDYLFFWCDQAAHLQLIDVNATGTNVIINCAQYAPFVMSDGDLLAAADESVISDGTDTLRPIDKILIGQESGSTANYVLVLVD